MSISECLLAGVYIKDLSKTHAILRTSCLGLLHLAYKQIVFYWRWRHQTYRPTKFTIYGFRERKFEGTKVSGHESSKERKFHLWNFSGTKVPVTLLRGSVYFAECGISITYFCGNFDVECSAYYLYVVRIPHSAKYCFTICMAKCDRHKQNLKEGYREKQYLNI